MSNLLTLLPHFDPLPFSHILPSLEKARVSTADLLTLDPSDVAKRAQVPPSGVKKLADALLDALHAGSPLRAHPTIGRGGFITTLDDGLDSALGGGVSVGCLTEIVGESAAGKTQFLLTLLLSVQLPPPQGLGKAALYISTEAPLQTKRLSQILDHHPKLQTLSAAARPSFARVQSTRVHDLEAQDHILRYQVPVAVERSDIGLIVVDSIAANYRPEFGNGARPKAAESFAERSNQLTGLGALLHGISRDHGVAVVVANQVADRFVPVEPVIASESTTSSQHATKSQTFSSPPSIPCNPAQRALRVGSESSGQTLLSTDDPLSLDHQQRFFTGWGDDLTVANLKTPSLGLTWTNQLSARLAFLKEPVYPGTLPHPGEDRNVAGWHRTLKIVFSAWCDGNKIAFEIWEGGIRSVEREA